MARIDRFQMERYQSLYWHDVDYDLSESGVRPLTVEELLRLGGRDQPEALLGTTLGYPLSEGSALTRARIASWYPGATADEVTVVNGGSEANHLVLWSLLRPKDRLAFMIPNYLQGQGLGRFLADRVDPFRLRLRGRGGGHRWRLDLEDLDRAVTKRTRVIMLCNPNNPTGYVLSEAEMDAVVDVARRVGAWIVADEIYRGAEVDTDAASPTFWGRYERVVVTSGLSKAFAMPGLRVGWAVAPQRTIEAIRAHHDYTTLTPGKLSDELAAVAMESATREAILARTRGIVRANLPSLETWIHTHHDIFRYARPAAGAIAYVAYDLPIASSALVERIRLERSVLLVPGDMLGLRKGLRFGFGSDIDWTLAGLTRVDEVLAGVARGA
jgi:hypothetical protein